MNPGKPIAAAMLVLLIAESGALAQRQDPGGEFGALAWGQPSYGDAAKYVFWKLVWGQESERAAVDSVISECNATFPAGVPADCAVQFVFRPHLKNQPTSFYRVGRCAAYAEGIVRYDDGSTRRVPAGGVGNTLAEAQGQAVTLCQEGLGLRRGENCTVKGAGCSADLMAQDTTQRSHSARVNRVMWAAKRSNVRSGPGTEHKRVGLLEIGDQVHVTGQSGNWFRIRRQSGQAFVYAPLLTSRRPGGARQAEMLRPRGPTRRQQATARQGRRTISYNNARYEGDTRNGKEHGQGTMTWNDGTRYQGQWRDGTEHGHGIKIYNDGDRYKGQWRSGKRHGRGAYTWANGNRYEGDFVNGRRTGRGTFTWPNGHRYEGGFVDNKRHGRGKYTWPNGNRYEGDFVNGRRSGRGTYTWTDGTWEMGIWENGKLVRGLDAGGPREQEQWEQEQWEAELEYERQRRRNRGNFVDLLNRNLQGGMDEIRLRQGSRDGGTLPPQNEETCRWVQGVYMCRSTE